MALTKVSQSMIQGAPANVVDFGAVGDGVTDDTAAFVAAFAYLESAGGGVLQLAPDSNFLLSTWTAVATISTIQVEGQGSKITGPVSGLGVCFKPSNSFVFSNIVFERWGTVFLRELADSGVIANATIKNNTFLTVNTAINLECPCENLSIDGNTITGGTGQVGIRIGVNTKALETGWTRIKIVNNTITARSTTGTTGNYPILSYSQHSIIANNIIRNIRSVNAECFGIYLKVRFSSIYGNIIEDVRSTGTAGDYADCVGLSIKGDIRIGSTPGGYKNTCFGNTIKNIGVQLSHGSGIKTQTEENIISNNIIEDVGFIGIDANDFGLFGTIITSNTIKGINVLGTYGIWVQGVSDGYIVNSNQIIDYVSGIRLDGGANPSTVVNVSDNFIRTTVTSANAILFASGTVRECSISNNTVDLSGSGSVVIATDTTNHVNVTVQNNNFQIPATAGFPLFSGSFGSGLRVIDNRGYKSQTSGIASVPSGAGGLTINHGLYATPQGVVATIFNNTAATATAFNFTSTQLTLSHSAGTTQSVSWIAWVSTSNA